MNLGQTFVLLVLPVFFLAGCGLGANQDGSNTANTSGSVITGIVAKGPVSGAMVRAYRPTTTGREPLSNEVPTGTVGDFSLSLTPGYTGPVILEATGGSYTDEATGAVVTLAVPLRTMLPSVGQLNNYAITALTELAARSVTVVDSAAIEAANLLISRRLSGQGASAVDFLAVIPVNAAASPPAGSSNTQINHGLLLATISQYAATQHAGNLGLALDALATDFADGVFNTHRAALASAHNAFLASTGNLSGISATDLDEIILADGNNAPIALDGNASVPYQTTISGTLSASDVNGDALTYSVTTAPTKGQVSLLGAGFTFQPNALATGTDSFSFQASDGVSSSNIAVMSLNIGTPGNTAPVANAGVLAVPHNTLTSGTLSANDADGDPLMFTISVNGTKGTASITNAATGAYNYTPTTGATGDDSFQFFVNDGTQNSNVAVVSVSIGLPGNNTPVANNATLSVLWNTPVSSTLSATDADGDALTYILVTPPGIGTVTLGTGGQYTYTPGTGTGSTAFTFKVNDGLSDSNTATVTLNIQGGNYANGASLYSANCSSCHGVGAATTRRNRTVSQIKTAIATRPLMSPLPNLQALTDAQIGDIAAWLQNPL